MTSYIVLKRADTESNTGIDSWSPVAKAEAVSAPAAIRAALDGLEHGGEFVAVPARSWQPVMVSVERQIKLG